MALAVVVVGVVGGFYLWAHESVALLRPTSAEGQQDARTARPAQVRGDRARARLRPPRRRRRLSLALGHDDADPRRPGHEHDLDALVPARPAGPLYCPARAAAPRRTAPAGSTAPTPTAGSAARSRPSRHLTNLPINYLIPINFLGFIGVVNKLGGVWLDVDRRYYNKNVGTSGTDYANINLQPGYQHLTGKQALDFVRFRHTDSDLYRLARQQLFVEPRASRWPSRSVSRPCSGSSTRSRRTTTWRWSAAGGGQPQRHQEIRLVRLQPPARPRLPGEDPEHLRPERLATDQSNITDAVQQFLNPDVGEASTATAVALGRKLPARKRTIPPRQVTLTVLNGNGVAGSAGNASYLLGQKGYVTVTPANGQPANAPNWNYFHSKVYYDPARAANGKVAAQQVSKLIGSADVEPLPAAAPAARERRAADVIVGSTFHGALTPVVIPTAPTRQPRAGAPRPGGDALDAVQAAQAAAVHARVPDEARELLQPGHRLWRDTGPDLSARRPADAAADLPQGRQRVLGHPGDALGRRARSSTTRASPSASTDATSTSTTRARTCTWSCCATTAPPTGS